MLSSLVLIFKGKEDPFNPNSESGMKLLEHAFKLFEKILDRHLDEMVKIDKIQCGFIPGRVQCLLNSFYASVCSVET